MLCCAGVSTGLEHGLTWWVFYSSDRGRTGHTVRRHVRWTCARVGHAVRDVALRNSACTGALAGWWLVTCAVCSFRCHVLSACPCFLLSCSLFLVPGLFSYTDGFSACTTRAPPSLPSVAIPVRLASRRLSPRRRAVAIFVCTTCQLKSSAVVVRSDNLLSRPCVARCRAPLPELRTVL